MLKTHRKFTGLILTLAVVAAIFFGMNAGMDMSQNGTMSGCIFDQSGTYSTLAANLHCHTTDTK